MYSWSGRNKGFTLIELLIVIAIIAVLVAVALPQFMKSKKSANQSAMQHSLRDLITGELQYFTENNSLFGTLADLATGYYIDMGHAGGGGLAAQDLDYDCDTVKEAVATMNNTMWARDRYYWQFSTAAAAGNRTAFACATIPMTPADGDYEYFMGFDNVLRKLADNDDDVMDITSADNAVD